MNYTCIDGFSGSGGLCLGLSRACFDILFSFDKDALCIKTQNSNPKYFSHRAVEADIADMLGGNLLKMLNLTPGELFLLAGGPPCQGFSIQRIGKDEDIRNDLVIRYVELVEELKPRFFLIENVPGIIGKRGKTILEGAFLQAAKAGYWIHKQILDAQDFGVPQRRRRLFVVGERMDQAFPLFHFPAPKLGRKLTVRDTIGWLPSPPENGRDHPDIIHHRRDKLSDMNKQRLMALREGQGRDYLPEDLLVKAHRVSSSIMGHRNVYGRMAWDDVAPTITARFDSFTRGKFGHPEQLRSITLREGALLQTFPLEYNFSGNKVDIARQIGNAVPPVLAEAIGRQIIECYEESNLLRKNGNHI